MISKEELTNLLNENESIDKEKLKNTDKNIILSYLDTKTSIKFIENIKDDLNLLNIYLYDIYKLFNIKKIEIKLDHKENYPFIVKYFIELSYNYFNDKDYSTAFGILKNILVQLRFFSFPSKEEYKKYFEILSTVFIHSNNFLSGINALYRLNESKIESKKLLNEIENKIESKKSLTEIESKVGNEKSLNKIESKKLLDKIINLRNEENLYKKYFIGLEIYSLEYLEKKIDLKNIEIDYLWMKVIENENKKIKILENLELFSFSLINEIVETDKEYFTIKKNEKRKDIVKRIHESIEVNKKKEIKKIEKKVKEEIKVEKKIEKKKEKIEQKIDYFSIANGIYIAYHMNNEEEDEDLFYEERIRIWNEICKRKIDEENSKNKWYEENINEIEEMGRELEELIEKDRIKVEKVVPTVTVIKERRSWRTEKIESYVTKKEKKDDGGIYTFQRNNKFFNK